MFIAERGEEAGVLELRGFAKSTRGLKGHRRKGQVKRGGWGLERVGGRRGNGVFVYLVVVAEYSTAVLAGAIRCGSRHRASTDKRPHWRDLAHAAL